MFKYFFDFKTVFSIIITNYCKSYTTIIAELINDNKQHQEDEEERGKSIVVNKMKNKKIPLNI